MAYHPTRIDLQAKLNIWYQSFGVGDILPILPPWFDAYRCLPLMLQETYEQTWHSQRIISAIQK